MILHRGASPRPAPTRERYSGVVPEPSLRGPMQPWRGQRTIRMHVELDRAARRSDDHRGAGGLPARDDVGLGKAPAIAMPGRHQRPARLRRIDEGLRRGRAAAVVRDGQHVHAPGDRRAPASRPPPARSMSPVSSSTCGPTCTRSTHERSLSPGGSSGPGCSHSKLTPSQRQRSPRRQCSIGPGAVERVPVRDAAAGRASVAPGKRRRRHGRGRRG